MTKNRYEQNADEMHATLDALLIAPPDTTVTGAETRLKATQSLIGVLDTALKIAGDFMVSGDEPYPGAALNVVRTSRKAVELARASNLIPPR